MPDETVPGGRPGSPGETAPGTGSAPAEPAPSPAGSQDTAGFGARFLAVWIDWLLCMPLAGLFAGLFTGRGDIAFWVYPVLLAEYGFFVGLFTQTPGMWLAKVRCVSTTDLGAIGVPRALLRTVLMCLVVPVVIMDRYGRGLHDKAVGSVMLAAPRAPARAER